MAIDLNIFAGESEATVPVLNNTFQYNRKKYQLNNRVADGWYKVSMINNDASIIEEAYPEFCEFDKKNLIKGYVFNNNIVFQNFDVAKRKFNLEIQDRLFLNNFETFSSIDAVYWEDKRIYSVKINYNDYFIFDVKSKFDNKEDIKDIKGVTPELKVLYVNHDIQRQGIAKLLQEAKEKEERRNLYESIPGRINIIMERVGATVESINLNGSRINVVWYTENSSYRYNSVLSAQTFEVIEAGYCMSGDDKRHNLTSLVLTAKEYEDEDLIYITRH